jgi:adhesin transport system outer membrane protein
VRQTVAIAHNDIRKLKDQLKALDRNVLAIEKARDAYRQQFDIGQRSLLDLLNAENELYTAKRAYANAEHDLQIAYARTHAAQQTLSSTLGLTRDNTGNDAAQNWQAASDAAGDYAEDLVLAVALAQVADAQVHRITRRVGSAIGRAARRLRHSPPCPVMRMVMRSAAAIMGPLLMPTVPGRIWGHASSPSHRKARRMWQPPPSRSC